MITTTAEDIAQRVRFALATGELDRRRTYTEPELLELSLASRPVLREALRVLESEQLVTVRRGPRGGARFARPGALHVARYAALLLYHSGTTLGDVEQARALLETEIVRNIGLHQADVHPAESALVAEAASLNQPDELPRHASAWHRALLGSIGNSALEVLLGIVDLSVRPLAKVARARTASSEAGRRNLRHSHVIHAQVLQRLGQGDSDGAAGLWLRHTRAGERLFSAVAYRERLDLLDLIDGVTPGDEPGRSLKGADVVAASLRRRIATGDLRSGDRLPTEGALAGEWGLAAPSIREATRILAAEGLVAPVRGSHLGPVVRAPDAGIAVRRMALVLAAAGTSLPDLRQAIMVITAGAVTLLATGDAGDRLSGLPSRLSAAEADDDPEYAIIDAVLDSAGNTTLHVLGTILTAVGRSADRSSPDRARPDATELAALLKSDSASARRWVQELFAPGAWTPPGRPLDVLSLLA